MSAATIGVWPLLLRRTVLARAAIIALALGIALTVINQSPAIFGEADIRALPLVLVFLTPFVVVALSQGLGARQAVREGATARAEPFLVTLAGHGIPRRAALLGLAAGAANSSVALAASAATGDAGPPAALLAQAFVLPTLFGALSQALAYGRLVGRQAGR